MTAAWPSASGRQNNCHGWALAPGRPTPDIANRSLLVVVARNRSFTRVNSAVAYGWGSGKLACTRGQRSRRGWVALCSKKVSVRLPLTLVVTQIAIFSHLPRHVAGHASSGPAHGLQPWRRAASGRP